ncbi:MAG: hypothetical protein IKD94_02765 [Erysipelotrichaceae bacterium]|nr:hypothetical protein [Erysipelotrichaceae bacterium]
MNSETKTDLNKIALNVIGVANIGFGFALMASSEIGLDCLDSFNEAVSIYTGRDFSVVANITETIMILAAYMFEKKNIGLGTILYMLVIDVPLSYFKQLLPNSGGSFAVSIIYSFLGVFFLSFGIELTIHSELGTVAYEAFIQGLKKKMNYSFVMTKYAVDAILLAVTVSLGEKLRLGTIICFLICPLLMEEIGRILEKHSKNRHETP